MMTSFNRDDKKNNFSRVEASQREKDFTKYPYKSEKSQKYFRCVLCHLTNLVRNKPL